MADFYTRLLGTMLLMIEGVGRPRTFFVSRIVVGRGVFPGIEVTCSSCDFITACFVSVLGTVHAPDVAGNGILSCSIASSTNAGSKMPMISNIL